MATIENKDISIAKMWVALYELPPHLVDEVINHIPSWSKGATQLMESENLSFHEFAQKIVRANYRYP